MPQTHLGRTFLAALTLPVIVAPAWADGPQQPAPYESRAATRPLPELRERRPANSAPRQVRFFESPPTDLIQAYLPRYTEKPIYNEPPSRFPQR